MHLPERHTHLLEHVFLLDAGADQIRLHLLDELLELVSGHVVIDQRAVLDVVLGGPLIVVVVAELVAGADHLHAEVFIGADHVARPQSADEQHHGLAFEARPVPGDHRVHQGLVLGDDALGAFLDLVVEEARDLAQQLGDLARPEEVVFAPRNTVLLFHVPRDVVHRAVAVQHVELCLRRRFELGETAVTRPLRDHAQAHLLEQDAGRPGIATDIVVADDGHVIGRRFESRRRVRRDLVEHPIPDRVVGDVVAERLGHAAETFAAHRNDGLAVVFLRFHLGDGLDVVADQTDRALRLDRDAPVEREQLLDLVHDLGELLVAAEDDVLLLEIGGELHGHEGVDTGRADVVVAPRRPGILAASHRTMADVDHVLDRTPHHALRAGVGAAADRHHAGDRLDVRLHAAIGFARLMHVQMLGAALRGLFRIDRQYLGDQFLVASLDLGNTLRLR